jgi:squalene-hopene/tetraprenyl-beta-curcumene cyclase
MVRGNFESEGRHEGRATRHGAVVAGEAPISLDRAIEATSRWLLDRMVKVPVPSQSGGGPEEGGYWLGELEADTTLESDYILFLYYLDPRAHREKISKLANYIKKHQLPDGSWNIYHGGPGDVSASVKAYFALKLAGSSTEEPFMVEAREAILRMGGVEKVNTFTKIYLSFLNQVDWNEIPAIPPEIVLLPRFFYFNIYEISYWSRAILIPLSILYAKKPTRSVDSEVNIRELFANGNFRNGSSNGRGRSEASIGKDVPGSAAATNGKEKENGRDPNILSWRNFFLLMDRLLKLVERAPIKPLRNLALKKAEQWMVSRTEDSDGLGAIFPAMVNSVLAMRSLGYEESHPYIANTLDKLRELEIEEGDALRLQPCLSPVWDTALALNALREAGLSVSAPEISASGRWLVSKEVRKSGDWQLRVPGVEASGWYFQFQNEFYPDIDDTAAVLLALERVDPRSVDGLEASIGRGVNWVISLQCSNGGWAAFDADVQRQALTYVPYADHNAMLDPACADITGRVLEMLGRFPSLRAEPRVDRAIQRGIQFLKDEQEDDGSWYGRWGVNYIYGTWQTLKGLMAVGENPRAPYIRRAVAWLEARQNPDGGWGESCASYGDPKMSGRGASTASQTAWAVMGLASAGEARSSAARRGIDYLLSTQLPDGSWEEAAFTGTGFPGVFYLKYHYYRVYFPLFALAYHRNVLRGTHPAPGGVKIVLPEQRKRAPGTPLAQQATRLRGLFGMTR